MMYVRVLAAVLLILFSPYMVNGQIDGLSGAYYSKSCPLVEKIVEDAMRSAVKLDPTTPAAILRLVFHDCQVGVCLHTAWQNKL